MRHILQKLFSLGLRLIYRTKTDRILIDKLAPRQLDALKRIASTIASLTGNSQQQRFETKREDWVLDRAYSAMKVFHNLNRGEISAFASTIHDLKQRACEQPKLVIVARPHTAHFTDSVLSIFSGYDVHRITHISKDLWDLSDSLSKQDVLWFEWGTAIPMVDFFSNSKALKALRIHDNELLNDWPLFRSRHLNSIDAFIFVNPDAKRDFQELTHSAFRDKSYVVPHIAPATQQTRPRESQNILMSMVQLSRRKDVARALQIFRRLLDIHPHLNLTLRIGKVTDSLYFEEILREIRELGLEENVKIKLRGFIGDKTRTTVEQIGDKASLIEDLSSHTFVWSTSTREAFHYFIAEGIRAGCAPLVLSWGWGSAKSIWGPFALESEQDFESRMHSLLTGSSDDFQSFVKSANNWLDSNNSPQIVKQALEKALGRRLQSDQVARTIVIAGHNPLFAPGVRRGGEHSSRAIVQALVDSGYQVISLVAMTTPCDTAIHRNELATEVIVPKLLATDLFDEIVRVFSPSIVLATDIAASLLWRQCVSHGIPYILFTRWWRAVDLPPYHNLETSPIRSRDAERRAIHQNASLNIVNAKQVGRVLKRYFGVDSVTSYVPVQKPKAANISARTPGPVLKIAIITPEKFPGAQPLMSEIAETLGPQSEIYTIGGKYIEVGQISHMKGFESPYWEWLVNYDLVLFPFQDEPCGTGRITQECHNLGIPILGSALGGLAEHIPPEHLIDDFSNPVAWAKKINDVANRYKFHSTIALNQAQNYDPEKELRVILGEIEKILEGETAKGWSQTIEPGFKGFKLLAE